ncbi:MAG: 4-alpha-glucanotransferase [Lachnospiraceae bacterium]|nr:4-alpha-glucanotransferase [Lachnospiraceae bacterium]
MRKNGVLMPVASLPGKYGIGCFSKEAYKFIDNLKAAGQSYWQILPLGPTGYGDSPYQSFSTFAGNPYFIDLETLIEEGLLKRAECGKYDWGSDPHRIDYEKIYLSRFKVLKHAFKRFDYANDKDYGKFVAKNSFWLEDYALYMAVKNSFGGVSFIEWDEDIRRHEEKAVDEYRKKYAEEVEFYKFIQYEFDKQWTALKSYANKNGVEIIGDIPIYVAFDSADTWAEPKLFQFDKNGIPTAVAGTPPDAFSKTGQMWGNPLYAWKYHKETGYEWWIKRIRHCLKLYDIVRIDHFRGFDEYYSIPYGSPNAVNGKWVKGPGYALFRAIKKELGDVNVIAEDLGFLTPSVLKLVKDTGFPGMKVLEFAFDSREDSDYLPHNYVKNSIVYTSAHDNDTILGWYDSISKADREYADDYLNNAGHTGEELAWDYIRLAMASVSDTCIISMHDFLALGSEARINIPSTLGGNWVWRMDKDAFTKALIKKIYFMTCLYSRYPQKLNEDARKKAEREKTKAAKEEPKEKKVTAGKTEKSKKTGPKKK